jgi:hypothetical protein
MFLYKRNISEFDKLNASNSIRQRREENDDDYNDYNKKKGSDLSGY